MEEAPAALSFSHLQVRVSQEGENGSTTAGVQDLARAVRLQWTGQGVP